MERPEDVTENGEYIEPNTFEKDREAVLFYSYIEQIKYIEHLEKQVRIAVEKALEIASDLSQEMIYDRQDTKLNPDGGLILREFQVCYAVPKQTILSLTDKVINELNK